MTGHTPHGSLATEASLLLAVVADKLEPIVQAGRDRAADPEAGAAGETSAQAPERHETCTSCPICVVITVVKSDNGEINHKLAEGALMMVNALRGMLADAAPTTSPADTSSTDTSATDTSPTNDSPTANGTDPDAATQSPPVNPVQHIDIN